MTKDEAVNLLELTIKTTGLPRSEVISLLETSLGWEFLKWIQNERA